MGAVIYLSHGLHVTIHHNFSNHLFTQQTFIKQL